MLTIRHAILHVFDFETGSSYLSQRELDLSHRTTKSYVQRNVRKVLNDPEARVVEPHKTPEFVGEFKRLARGEHDFVVFSTDLAQWFWEELRRCERPEPMDLLCVEFCDTETPTSSSERATGGEFEDHPSAAETPETQALDYDAEPMPFFAAILLPRKHSFVHELNPECNTIATFDAVLPTPGAKPQTFLLVNLESYQIAYKDKARSYAGQEVELIPEHLLKSEGQVSNQQLVQEVSRIVEDLAEDYGLNAAEEITRTKASLHQHMEKGEALEPERLAHELYSERPEMSERFCERARAAQLPEQADIPQTTIRRQMRQHKIKTDTGIEISFPTDLAERPGYLEFIRNEDGSMAIHLGNITRIENR